MQGYEPSYRPDYSPWEGGGATAAPDGVEVKRSRPGLIAVVAVVTLLVLIAGVGNQKVADLIDRHFGTGDAVTYQNAAMRSLLVYRWRFTPLDNDSAHLWSAGLAFLGAALVLTFLITLVLTRGRGGLGHLFVAVWSSVVIATMLAGYVRALVLERQAVTPGVDKVTSIFFSTVSPGAYTFAAGLAFGFVVAIVAALVGASARRTDVVGGDPGYVPPGPAYEPQQQAQQQPQQQPQQQEPVQPWGTTVPGPVGSPSPWSTQHDEDAARRTAQAEQAGRAEQAEQAEQAERQTPDVPPADQPQHTAVLPTVGNHEADSADSADDAAPDTGARTGTDTSTQALPRSGGDPQRSTDDPQRSNDDPQRRTD